MTDGNSLVLSLLSGLLGAIIGVWGANWLQDRQTKKQLKHKQLDVVFIPLLKDIQNDILATAKKYPYKFFGLTRFEELKYNRLFLATPKKFQKEITEFQTLVERYSRCLTFFKNKMRAMIVDELLKLYIQVGLILPPEQYYGGYPSKEYEECERFAEKYEDKILKLVINPSDPKQRVWIFNNDLHKRLLESARFTMMAGRDEEKLAEELAETELKFNEALLKKIAMDKDFKDLNAKRERLLEEGEKISGMINKEISCGL